MAAANGGGSVPSILDLCEQFAALPFGTVAKFVEGVDFTVKAGTFRNRLHREMRTDGYIVESVVRGDAVYARVKRKYGKADEQSSSANGPEQIEDLQSKSDLPGPDAKQPGGFEQQELEPEKQEPEEPVRKSGRETRSAPASRQATPAARMVHPFVEPAGPVASELKVPGPTNPRVPGAVFQTPQIIM